MFLPQVALKKSGDNITVMIRQKYHPRGHEWINAYRWRIVGNVSLRELEQTEQQQKISKRQRDNG